MTRASVFFTINPRTSRGWFRSLSEFETGSDPSEPPLLLQEVFGSSSCTDSSGSALPLCWPTPEGPGSILWGVSWHQLPLLAPQGSAQALCRLPAWISRNAWWLHVLCCAGPQSPTTEGGVVSRAERWSWSPPPRPPAPGNYLLGLRLVLDSMACSFKNENAIINLEIRQGVPMKPRPALNSASSCLSLLRAGMIGMQ